MSRTRATAGLHLLVTVTALALLLAGCEGSKGSRGATGPAGPPGTSTASELNMTITGATISSPPVVNFTVTNQNGQGFTGLTTSDLRFLIAKLTPSTADTPSSWQNYIVTVQNATAPGAPLASAVQGTRENNGTLVDHGDGTYTYTFNTDIANVTCPAPCQDYAGNPLDLSYQPTLTHRVGIQTRGSLPPVNAVFDFVPAGGPVTLMREITKTANCEECHDRLIAHDARIEIKYCVACHNRGSTDPDSGNTVDMEVMIHKIHRGAELPSVVAGGDYEIIGHNNSVHSFNDVHFPQDIRNCTKCHDGSDPDTPQGNNWMTRPSIQACGSCHDDIDFSKDGSVDPDGHPGGIVSDNSECLTCHETGRIAGSIADSHRLFGEEAVGNFQYNIISICGTPVGSNPICAPGAAPVVVLSVSDPTGATTHTYGNNYDVRADAAVDPEFGAGSSLNVLVAWDTRDYQNVGGIGTRPSRADSYNVRTTAVDNADGTFTLTATNPVPDGTAAPNIAASGSGTIAIEGRPLTPGEDGVTYTERAPVAAATATFRITDATAVPRRVAVNIQTHCDRCHDVLTLHGNTRSDNAQLCVMCHNPQNTDVSQRPKDGAGALDPTATLDEKGEESIDMKRMIHAIHAAAETNHDGTLAHGFREEGIVIYGFGGGPNDYSHVRFPGDLTKCTTCHLDGKFTLEGIWEAPAQNGIQGSTIESAPGHTDAASLTAGLLTPVDDLKISPTAAVCSACHDGTLARAHMTLNGGLFGATQATITTNIETCAVCHGPGRTADVEVVHTGQGGEVIP